MNRFLWHYSTLLGQHQLLPSVLHYETPCSCDMNNHVTPCTTTKCCLCLFSCSMEFLSLSQDYPQNTHQPVTIFDPCSYDEVSVYRVSHKTTPSKHLQQQMLNLVCGVIKSLTDFQINFLVKCSYGTSFQTFDVRRHNHTKT